jgi:hypothetical protein
MVGARGFEPALETIKHATNCATSPTTYYMSFRRVQSSIAYKKGWEQVIFHKPSGSFGHSSGSYLQDFR